MKVLKAALIFIHVASLGTLKLGERSKLAKSLERHKTPVECTFLRPTEIALIKTKEIYKCGGNACLGTGQIAQEVDHLTQLNLNHSVDPCQDFYSYVCSGWETRLSIPPDKEEYTVFDMLADKVNQRISDLMASLPKDVSPKSLDKAAQLYRGCMDKDTRETIGIAPLQDLLHHLGGWPIVEGGKSKDWDHWLDTAIYLQLYLGIGALMNVGIHTNLSDNRLKTVTVGYPSTTAYELRDWKRKNRFRRNIVLGWFDEYQMLIRDSALLLGAKNGSVLFSDATDIAAFELELAMAQDDLVNATRMTVKNMEIEYPNIHWEYLFSEILGISEDAASDIIVLIENKNYLEFLNSLIEASSNRALINYMLWNAVLNSADYTTEKFRHIMFQHTKMIYGTILETSLEQTCAEVIENLMGIAVSPVYVQRYFPISKKQDVEFVLKEVQYSFEKTISSSDWMDNKTKKLAIKKLKSMKSIVGYPDWILDQDAVEAFYEGLGPLDEKKYFESIYEVKSTLMKKKYKTWNSINSRDNESQALGTPLAVNAFYSVWANTIYFPAAVLEQPVFGTANLMSMNFGALGSILAHEITHAFDEDGSVIGHDGNLKDWWSPWSRRNFENRVGCFVDQYNAYADSKPPEKVDRLKTTNDDIADNGGIRNAYRAYRSFVKQKEEYDVNRIMPVLNVTVDQLFFIAFANVWCGKFREQFMKRMLSTATHSPNHLRVRGSVSNSKEFASAFGCEEGFPMNPTNKCVLW